MVRFWVPKPPPKRFAGFRAEHQMDAMLGHALADGRRCHPLTALDDHSRYSLGLVACVDERTVTVQKALRRFFARAVDPPLQTTRRPRRRAPTEIKARL